ncbi:MAG: 23S rRNA (adenine(2503)-C(2))-methyltransferase RlmN [Acidobacteriota bacterium]|nr:23S rRNA (adenine(2503)-C(2))-methyltransferase RlmN [Acidobacteriota bacterium]
MEKLNLIGATLEEIETALAGLGEPRYRARQVYAGIYGHLYSSWDQFTDLGKRLRSRLEEKFSLTHLSARQVFISKDGTRRYLFEIGPSQKIESVFIPEERRDTLCISTQVGCAIGCLFCATGRLSMRRNLLPGEIVGQILTMQAERRAVSRRLNIVIMGMGEPLHNYENVMKAVGLMTDEGGMSISPRRITLSTSGIVPGIQRLAREALTRAAAIPNLAISLNATTDSVRDLLMPINKKWNIAALLEACRSFPLAQRRRITFEYVLIEGINDSPEDARGLAKLLQGIRKKVNLIPLNADPLIPLKPSPPARVLAFQEILASHHITVNIRRPRGDDVSAACGMLAGREHEAEKA